jgi:molybdopterin molybdotransferase
VAYFSTGDEILSLGEPPREGAVYDSNRYTVFGLLTRLGVEVIDLGVVRDEPALLEAAFRDAAQGRRHHHQRRRERGRGRPHRTMMKKLGDVAFWRIAMRPGRPMAVGRIASAGFQAKSASSAYAESASSYQNEYCVSGKRRCSVWPARQPGGGDGDLSRLCAPRPAAHDGLHPRRTATAARHQHRSHPQKARPHRIPARHRHHGADGTLQVRTTGNQGSGVLSSMVQANGLIVLHHGQGNVAPGDAVDVMVFDGVI